jgi:hypothetical protein
MPAISDMLIVGGMSYFFIKGLRASDFKSTRSLLLRYLVLLVETNGLTCAVCFVNFALYARNQEAYGAVFSFISPRLYDL